MGWGLEEEGGGRFWLEKGTDHMWVFFLGGGYIFIHFLHKVSEKRSEQIEPLSKIPPSLPFRNCLPKPLPLDFVFCHYLFVINIRENEAVMIIIDFLLY